MSTFKIAAVAGYLYSSTCRDDLFSETRLRAYKILTNLELPEMPLLANSGHKKSRGCQPCY